MPRDLGESQLDKILDIQPKESPKMKPEKKERLEREAKALRLNLLRRKQQGRVRSAASSSLIAALRNEEHR